MAIEKQRITLRVTAEEKAAIEQRAKSEGMNLNQYLTDKALCGTSVDGRLRSDIMRELCLLQNQLNAIQYPQDVNTVWKEILDFRARLVHRLEVI